MNNQTAIFLEFEDGGVLTTESGLIHRRPRTANVLGGISSTRFLPRFLVDQFPDDTIDVNDHERGKVLIHEANARVCMDILADELSWLSFLRH